MLAGRPPVQHELGSETIHRIASNCVPSLREMKVDVPTWLLRMVDWLHEEDPRRRPKSAEEVAVLLEQCLSHQRQPGQHALPEQLTKSKRFPNRATIFVCGAMISIVILVCAAMQLGKDPQSSTHTVDQPAGETIVDQATDDAGVSTDPHRINSELRWDYVDMQMKNIDQEVMQWEKELGDD